MSEMILTTAWRTKTFSLKYESSTERRYTWITVDAIPDVTSPISFRFSFSA